MLSRCCRRRSLPAVRSGQRAHPGVHLLASAMDCVYAMGYENVAYQLKNTRWT
jgi:hypothetical protein